MELGICRWCRLLSQDLKPSANSTVALQMPIAEKTNNWVNDCIMRCVTFASNVCTGPLKPPSPVQTIHSSRSRLFTKSKPFLSPPSPLPNDAAR